MFAFSNYDDNDIYVDWIDIYAIDSASWFTMKVRSGQSLSVYRHAR